MDSNESNRYRTVAIAMLVGGLLFVAAIAWALFSNDVITTEENSGEISLFVSTSSIGVSKSVSI